MKNTVESSKKIGLKINDVNKELGKYNQQLSRSLKTLEYIYIIETDHEKNHKMKHFEEFLKFKTNIQEHIIKITQKINYYQSLQNKLKS